MKKLLKIVGYLLAIVIVLAAAGLTYVKVALPNVGKVEDIKIEYTPERIERGQYLAKHVNVCMDCHSTRDWSKFSGVLKEGTLGQGGERFDQSVGMPGVVISRNITPTGIRRYTDGELFRVITTGVSKEGRAMFPLMPYSHYGQMDREDVYAVIAYIRSLSPIKNNVPESVLDFPMNFIVNLIPEKANLQKRPDTTDQLAYGAYMTNASGCIECHTNVEKGRIIRELAFSGAREFTFPDGSVVRSSNITPDKETGIGNWKEEMFIERFKAYSDSTYQPELVNPGEYNTYMPWTMYSGMKKEDLSAIFAYLQTVKPLKNQVTKFSSAAARH